MFHGRKIRLFEPSEEEVGTYADRVNDFFFFARTMGLHQLLRRLPAARILITNAAIKDYLENSDWQIEFTITTPEDCLSVIKGIAGPVMLLLPKDEAMVRAKVKTAFTQRKIISVLNDLLPRAMHEIYGAGTKITPETIDVEGIDRGRSPVLLIGTPASEVSYLAHVMKQAGLGDPKPYLNTIPAAFKALDGYFPLARYIQSIRRTFAEEGAVSAYLYSDSLLFMYRTRMVSKRRFNDYIRNTGTRVIYYKMRDKVKQALLSAYLDGRVDESLWELPERARERFNAKELSVERAFKYIFPQIQQDLEIERAIGSMPNVLAIGHEELLLAPKDVLTAISKHTNRPIKGGADIEWLRLVNERIPAINKQSKQLTRQMVDRLGLHINAAGSVITLQELINGVVEERLQERAEYLSQKAN